MRRNIVIAVCMRVYRLHLERFESRASAIKLIRVAVQLNYADCRSASHFLCSAAVCGEAALQHIYLIYIFEVYQFMYLT